jgi:hypothetical protein
VNADFLTRPPALGMSENEAEKVAAVAVQEANEKERTKRLQEEDADIKKVLDKLKKEGGNQDTKKTFEIADGVLYKKTREDGTYRYSLVVPQKMREEVLQAHHDTPAGGHFGRKRTLARMKRLYWWPNMSRDITAWTASCELCQKSKHKGGAAHTGPLQPMPAARLWERVALDLIVGLPRSAKGNTVVAVFSEAFSKFKWAIALPSKRAIGVARAYLENVVLPYGAPEKLLTDQGKEFMNEVMEEVNKLLGVKKINTSTYHPQTDGEVERFNRTLKEQLRAACGADQTDWDSHLPYIVSAYNATPHATTGDTPFYLMHGRDFMLPKDWSISAPATRRREMDTEDRRAMIRRLHAMQRRVGEGLQASAAKMKERYDKKVKVATVEEGQLVLLKNTRKPEEGQGAQLLPLWEGPFRVEKQTGPVTFSLVHLSNNSRRELVHIDRIKPYIARADEERQMEEGEYEVEDILEEKKEGGVTKYLVRWKGFTRKDDTWEPESNISSAQEILQRFKEGRRRRGEVEEEDSEEEEEEEEEDTDLEEEDADLTVEYPPEFPPVTPEQPPAQPRQSGRSTQGRASGWLSNYRR